MTHRTIKARKTPARFQSDRSIMPIVCRTEIAIQIATSAAAPRPEIFLAIALKRNISMTTHRKYVSRRIAGSCESRAAGRFNRYARNGWFQSPNTSRAE